MKFRKSLSLALMSLASASFILVGCGDYAGEEEKGESSADNDATGTTTDDSDDAEEELSETVSTEELEEFIDNCGTFCGAQKTECAALAEVDCEEECQGIEEIGAGCQTQLEAALTCGSNDPQFDCTAETFPEVPTGCTSEFDALFACIGAGDDDESDSDSEAESDSGAETDAPAAE
ncbi:MAG: hypothetical protein MK135_04850 [Polyangiaceae bacterium]|nr:hypothetical protein [Polyangiaceae bacterium]